MNRTRPTLLGWLATLGLVSASACAPKIGDHCTISTDCSVTGDRLCDSTQPSGYCTVFNCEPNSCPDDSICVSFNEPSCSSPVQSARFQRTFCMATCSSDSDCRDKYSCIDLANDTSRTREVVDVAPSTQKICTVTPGAQPATETTDAQPAVCLPPEAGLSSPEAGSEGDAAAPDAGTPDVSTQRPEEPSPDAESIEAAPDATSSDAPLESSTTDDGSAGEASTSD